MNMEKENEIISNDEANLYDYWKILVKRKKILIGIFLVPLLIVIIISLILPRYYRGESEISLLALPAPNIVNILGNVDSAKKVKIFASNASAINRVIISIPKKSTDKINIIVDAKSADIIPQAFKELFDYLSNLQEIKREIARIQEETDLKTEKLIEETDFKIKKLIEARKANLIFLNDLLDMLKKRKLTIVNFNPSDLIRKDGELALEIKNLEQAKADAIKKKALNIKVSAFILGPSSIAKQPSNAQIKSIIIFTGLLSLFIGLVIVFFLEYIEKMKARENK